MTEGLDDFELPRPPTLVSHYPSGVSGGIAHVYVISDEPPVDSLATIRGEGIGSGAFATWSSLPKPSSASTGLAALLVLAGMRLHARRRLA